MLKSSWGKWVRTLAVLLSFQYDAYFFDKFAKDLVTERGSVVCACNTWFDYVISYFVFLFEISQGCHEKLALVSDFTDGFVVMYFSFMYS